MEYSNLFVCLMGMGTVFVGLICIVVLVIGMSAICRKLSHIEAAITPAAPVAAAPAAPAAPQGSTANQGALMAAIAAAVAEDMGTDISAVRIVSIKKV